MDVLVTGAAGFIGSYALKALVDEGHQATALVRSPERAGALAQLPDVDVGAAT